jgi:hypothetical protein
MHHGKFATLDWILLALGPPLLGSGVGLLLGLARGRPGRAAVAGLAGGTLGAWAGVIAYCLAVLPRVHDPLIYTACVLVGFFLGAVPLGFFLAGPREPSKGPPFQPASGLTGSVLGGLLGLLLGIGVAYLGMEPSANGLAYLGYFVWPVIGTVVGAAAGLIAALMGDRPRGV